MIALAQQPRIMTDEEILGMAERLDDLRERGWSMTQIADQLGYSNPSTLYTAKRELCGIEVERYRELCRIHAEGREPSEGRVPRKDRKPSIPDERVASFLDVVAALQKKGVTQEAQAKAAGYGSSAGFRMALKARRIPVEVHDRVMKLAALRGVVKEAPPLPPVLEKGRGSWGVFDYFTFVATNIETCMALLEEASRELATPLTRPGYERFASRLREVADDVRAVVG
jgi:lambda repressor-like predicted transcriptional regulator